MFSRVPCLLYIHITQTANQEETTLFLTRQFLTLSFLALMDLVYWRNVKRTAVLFTGLVVGLACLFQLSAVTVVSYLCLGIICITFQLRLYYKLLELLHWNPDGVHPFQ